MTEPCETRRVRLGPFSVNAPRAWHDVTDELDTVERPWTLVRSNEGGAFQFSAASYRRGQVPLPGTDALLQMAREFGTVRGLGKGFDENVSEGSLEAAASPRIGAISYAAPDSFIRVWYVSDGFNLLMATFMADSQSPDRIQELTECEEMIRSVRWHHQS